MQRNIVQSRTASPVSELRTLLLASFEGALEFYDFVVCRILHVCHSKALLRTECARVDSSTQAFGIFAAAYLARPLGGIVMAHFGDTRGRKQMFTLGISLIALATLSIGLLPTYQSIGVTAFPTGE